MTKYNDDYSYANARLLKMYPCDNCGREELKSKLEEVETKLLCVDCTYISGDEVKPNSYP